MRNFEYLTEVDLMEVDGGAALEIMIGTKVFTGAAAFGIVGIGAVACVAVLGGVAYVGYRVATA